MNIVFCTTCKGRTQHLAQTLPQNLSDNPESRFVILDYNDQDGLADYLKTKHTHEISRIKVEHRKYLVDLIRPPASPQDC